MPYEKDGVLVGNFKKNIQEHAQDPILWAWLEKYFSALSKTYICMSAHVRAPTKKKLYWKFTDRFLCSSSLLQHLC